jgi:hypothetical protein
MAIQDVATLSIIGLNVILTLILLSIYYKNHRFVRSKMTLGLLFFALAFLVENIVDFYFYNSMVIQSILGFTTIHLLVNTLEMIGIIILLYVTWK